MKRSDLRAGMIVTLDCGRKGIVVEMCDYIGDLLEFDARLWERVSRRRFAEKEKREIVEQIEELTERLNKLEVK